MIREGINGFCMALADSVPGVSGGTVAFIMGFYDQFIGAVNNLIFGNRKEKKEAFYYLIQLGMGWITGMALAVLILSALFESHIYVISSLFIGFISGSIPLIITDEKESFRNIKKGIVWCILGIILVAGITFINGRGSSAAMELSYLTIGQAVRLFLIGMIAISAMFLPGISGSTLLLIFGAYIPVISAVKALLTLHFEYLPCLIFFGCGVFAGAAVVVKGIKFCLERFHVQTVYVILGMMIGSFYTIVMGPTTLKVPQMPLGISQFNIPACLIGIVLVAGMQFIKERSVEDED